MCNCCDPDYEALAKKCAEDVADLELKIEALEKALSFAIKCYKDVADLNYPLVCQNTHLMKKACYER